MMRATKHLEPCEDFSCKFCHPLRENNGIQSCCYGLRNTVGCIMEDDAVGERAEELIGLALASTVAIEEDEDYHHIKELTKRRMSKIFNFIHKGHEYRASDSARAQNTCPHCNNMTKNGRMFSKESREAMFLGSVDCETYTIECFECNECFKKFFFHL